MGLYCQYNQLNTFLKGCVAWGALHTISGWFSRFSMSFYLTGPNMSSLWPCCQKLWPDKEVLTYWVGKLFHPGIPATWWRSLGTHCQTNNDMSCEKLMTLIVVFSCYYSSSLLKHSILWKFICQNIVLWRENECVTPLFALILGENVDCPIKYGAKS